MFDIQEHLKTLPHSPGVYLMKDADGKIIYVGKSKNLKNRVRQYFQSSNNKYGKTKHLVKRIRAFEYIMTDTESEALILENTLIKKHKPRYNLLLKDDKTYPYIKVTVGERFPRVLKVRKIINDGSKYFGPYTNIAAVNDTIELINDNFKIRTCKIDIERAIEKKARPCLNFFIGRCMGPCSGDVDESEYKEMIAEVMTFLSGREETLVKLLKKKMYELSAEFNFEEAAVYRDKIMAVEKVIEKQKTDNALIGINQDVVALANDDQSACVQVFFIRNGKIVGREHFILDETEGEQKNEILSSFIKQFYLQQEYIPKEIIIEEDFDDKEVVEGILSDKATRKVNLTVPVKGDKKKLVEMVRKNAEEYLIKFADINRKKFEKTLGPLQELQRILELEDSPKRIESFDISNIQRVDSIGTMVGYTNGVKDRKESRRYKIKTVEGPDDYSSMREVLERRFKHGSLPDLILLDGGKGQVNAVKEVADLYGIEVPIWGMYKDERHRTKGLTDGKNEIELVRTSAIYRFVAGIQEEVHRFSISYHRSLRDKKMTQSILDDIPGIGAKRKKALLSHFLSVDNIKKASFEEILSVEGMNQNSAENVYNFFKG